MWTEIHRITIYDLQCKKTDVVTCSFGDFVTSRGADLPHTETQDDQDYWQKKMHLNLLESASIESKGKFKRILQVGTDFAALLAKFIRIN